MLKLVDSKVSGREVEEAPAPKPRGHVIDLMDALKKSLAGKAAQDEKKDNVAARKIEKIFSFAEFKSSLTALQIPEESLRQSYAGLHKVRKSRNLSWNEMREKVDTLGRDLQGERVQSKGKLKAARIPVTDRDWERVG